MLPNTFGPNVLKIIQTINEKYTCDEAKTSALLGLCMQMHYEGIYQALTHKRFQQKGAPEPLMEVYRQNATTLISSVALAAKKGDVSVNGALEIFDTFKEAFDINTEDTVREHIIELGERP